MTNSFLKPFGGAEQGKNPHKSRETMATKNEMLEPG